MLKIQQDKSFRELTTFKTGGPAKYFAEAENVVDLLDALAFGTKEQLPLFILGGGSNLLVSDAGFAGVVVRLSNLGITQVARDEESVTLKVGSGEVWDDVVGFAADHGLWGIENLSRIPGRTGALAVQNVGAYGAEASQVLESVEVFDRSSNTVRTLTNKECAFGYRKSIFNTSEKDRYIILATFLKLSRIPQPNLGYPDLQRRFEKVSEPALKDIRQAIKEIRDAKFPYPAESIEGNAGSFFKNVLLDREGYTQLESHFAKSLPSALDRLRTIRHKFPLESGIKIPTAFILESCGLKNFREGNVALNPTQPVIVLNWNGNATSSEILQAVRHVRTIVEERTGLHLLTEPELVGFTKSELEQFGFRPDEIKRYLP